MEIERLRRVIELLNDAQVNDFVIAEVLGEKRSRVYGLRRTVRDGIGHGRITRAARVAMAQRAREVLRDMEYESR